MNSIFPLSSPESKGISSENIIRFYEKLRQKNYPLHSAMLYVNGAVVSKTYCAPFREGQLHRMFSIAKTFTALAIGILCDQSRLSLEDRIVDFFPEKITGTPHPYLAALTIREMLMMRTCYTQTTYDKFDLSSDWVGSFFTGHPDKKSGTVFHYDTGAAHVLAALVEKITGMELLDFLRTSLSDLALSPESYMIKDGQGVSMGGTGLLATTEDLLKIGILLLQKGEYNGRQLISREFVKAATSNLTPSLVYAPIPSEASGYGYMIWQTEKEGFVCYGMGGQFIIAHPRKNILLITTADTQRYAGGNQILYDAFYENIYEPLPDFVEEPAFVVPGENPEALARLRALEAANTIKTARECLVGSTAVSAKATATLRPVSRTVYRTADNEAGFRSLSLELNASGGMLCLASAANNFHFTFAYDEMAEGVLEKYNAPLAGSGVWLAEDTLFLCFHIIGECVGSIHMELFFSEDDLVLTMHKVEETYFQEFDRTLVCHLKED